MSYLFIFVFFISSFLSANESLDWIRNVEGNCFTEHLKEAAYVNKQRGEIYAQMSNGQTRYLTNLIVSLDWVGTLFSKKLDRRSKKILILNNVPLLCEVIPSVRPILKRSTERTQNYDLALYKVFPVSMAISKIKKSYKIGGLKRAQEQIKKFINQLEKHQEFNCLTRQFLKSMNLLISKSINLSSLQAEDLCWDVVRLTLFQLRILTQIDRQASYFQAQGIPIICNEVPPFPEF